MVIKRIRFDDWKDLKAKALRYASMGFECEVKGWDDISNNILTVSDGEEAADDQKQNNGDF